MLLSLLCPETATSGQAATGSAKPILLVVDDDEGPRQALRIIFKDDYEVLTADNGSDALRIACERQVDTAVLDIRMPGMSGIELLSKLRKISPDTSVIILTGYESVETARQALRLGACDYFAKPFDLMAMRAAVAAATERHHAARQRKALYLASENLRDQVRNYQVQVETALQQGSIYASVLHDLNSPLGYIELALGILNEGINQNDVLSGAQLAKIRQLVLDIRQQLTNCQNISQRYLDILSARDRGKRHCAVNQVLQDLERLLRRHKKLRQNQFSVSLLLEDSWVAISGTDLVQIIFNLVSNAFECSADPHQVEIRAQILAVPLPPEMLARRADALFLNADHFENKSPLVQIVVQDNGPGIPGDILEKIFEPYFTTKGAEGGCGLGLHIVERLVKLSAGGLRIESQVGKGTVFSL
jgi:signal transduction histidine kinase